MSYWCDDRALYREQRRLDARQEEAEERLRQRPKPDKAHPMTRLTPYAIHTLYFILGGMLGLAFL